MENEAGKGKMCTRFGIETSEGRGKIRQSDKGEPGTGDKKRRGTSGGKEGRIVGKVKTVQRTTGINEESRVEYP